MAPDDKTVNWCSRSSLNIDFVHTGATVHPPWGEWTRHGFNEGESGMEEEERKKGVFE